MNTQLEELKQAIVKANPSIMNLEFGCEVKILVDDSDFYGKIEPYWVKVPIYEVSEKKVIITVLWSYPNRRIEIQEYIDKGRLKILGRPIRLADVLVAMEKHKEFWRYFLRPDGGFIEIDNIQGSRRVGFYDLTKTFEDQSPETINFLHKILVGEKG